MLPDLASGAVNSGGAFVDSATGWVGVWVSISVELFLEWVVFIESGGISAASTKLAELLDNKVVGGVHLETGKISLDDRSLAGKLGNLDAASIKLADAHNGLVAVDWDELLPGVGVLLVLVVPASLVDGRLGGLLLLPRVAGWGGILLVSTVVVVVAVATISWLLVATIAAVAAVVTPLSGLSSAGEESKSERRREHLIEL